MHIPPLAGLATYKEAAVPGYSVEENVQRFLRYAWIERKLMDACLYWHASTPEWEMKEALGLHAALHATNAAAIRERISEMRSPAPRMDVSPDPTLDTLFDELLSATTTVEKISGMYGVVEPALLAAFEQHYEHSNPVIDWPTRHMLKHLIVDQREIVAWGQAADTAAQAENAQEAASFTDHIRAYLAGTGGVMGADDKPDELPAPRRAQPFEPDYFPRRDERFALRWNFVNPQRQVSLNEQVPLDERILALMCRRIVEMDVPEYMTRIIAEAEQQPWEYYVAMTRQLWDEVRHASMGTIYFESRGVDWKRLIAIHPGMSIRQHSLTRQEAHAVLYAIEQNLMPATTGKKLEYQISVNAADPLAQHIQDYDWADEVLHVYIGRKWLLPELGMPRQEAVQFGLEARTKSAAALEEYAARGEQTNWWPEFVRAVLGRETAHEEFNLTVR